MSISSLWTRAVRLARWHRRALSAICAALAVICALQAVAPGPQATTSVAVAARDIAPGTRLQARDLATRAYPAALVPSGAVHDPTTAVGRAVNAALAAGTPLTERSFSSTASLAGQGEQLVGFRIPDASVLTLVHVGDLVSVVTTTQASASSSSPSDAVVTLATQVRVAALPQTAAGAGLGSSDTNGALVVVSCDPKTAATLAAWASSSQLGITLG